MSIPAIGRILAAVDGSELSNKALELGCQLACRFDADLHILHIPQGVVSDQVMFLGGAAVTIHATSDELAAAGQTIVDAAVAVAQRAGVGSISSEIRGGDPAHEIIACAKAWRADTIVLGSRGLGDIGSLVLGSVSHHVTNKAPCTCITVR